MKKIILLFTLLAGISCTKQSFVEEPSRPYEFSVVEDEIYGEPISLMYDDCTYVLRVSVNSRRTKYKLSVTCGSVTITRSWIEHFMLIAQLDLLLPQDVINGFSEALVNETGN